MALTGAEQMRRKLLSMARQNPARMERALYRRGEAIMTVSKKDFVPVDDGPLRASGRVTSGRNGDKVWAQLTYGGPAVPYARAVHEHPSQYDPPSWRGKVVKFHPAGRGPKYLERPVMMASRTLMQDLASDLGVTAA